MERDRAGLKENRAESAGQDWEEHDRQPEGSSNWRQENAPEAMLLTVRS